MIIYNVTISINPQIESEVIAWLQEIHIPEVLDTKLFTEHRMFKVLEAPRSKTHNSYAIQYTLNSWDDFDTYQEKYAPALKQKTQERYGENVLAFRTFLEKI